MRIQPARTWAEMSPNRPGMYGFMYVRCNRSPCKQGDEGILCGDGGMYMEEVAGLVATINCEPLSLLTQRVETIYI